MSVQSDIASQNITNGATKLSGAVTAVEGKTEEALKEVHTIAEVIDLIK